MEENIFYEVPNIHVASDVKSAYECAKIRNAKYYRCRSFRGGLIYGWVNGVVRASESTFKTYKGDIAKINGEYWFVNKNYSVSDVTACGYRATAEYGSIKIDPVNVINAIDNANEKAETKEQETSVEQEPNYKALYEATRNTLTSKTAEYDALKNSYKKLNETREKTIERLEGLDEIVDDLKETVEIVRQEFSAVKTINLE